MSHFFFPEGVGGLYFVQFSNQLVDPQLKTFDRVAADGQLGITLLFEVAQDLPNSRLATSLTI